MAAADVQPPGPHLDFAELERQLAKKATFESATRALAAAPPEALAAAAARKCLARCRTLLKARYTSRPFWVAGRQLFQSAVPAAEASGDATWVQQLQESIAECNAFLEGEREGPSAPAQQQPAPTLEIFQGRTGGFLFEGQLAGPEQPPPQPPGLAELLGSVMGPALAAQAQQGQQQQAGQAGAGEQQQAEEGPSPEVLEAIQRELDAIAVQIMEETGQQAQQRAPPASKELVASLPRERLTAERLQQLGGPDVCCPVCREELAAGAEVQVMPCPGSHVFHPDCAAPWLADNNTCPTCRHELPTDDWRYEAAKARAAEEAEAARGAANAVHGGEFLYI